MKLSDKDEGKRVVNKAGKKIGMVSQVEGNRAHVDPDPGISDRIKSKLGWGDADEDTYPIDESDIESINDAEVRLNR
jgi:sporulation protein YlmC with PRC-barrel domain